MWSDRLLISAVHKGATCFYFFLCLMVVVLVLLCEYSSDFSHVVVIMHCFKHTPNPPVPLLLLIHSQS